MCNGDKIYPLIRQPSLFPRISKRKCTTDVATNKEEISVIQGNLTTIDKEYHGKFNDIINALLKHRSQVAFDNVNDIRLREYDTLSMELKAGCISLEIVALIQLQQPTKGKKLYINYV